MLRVCTVWGIVATLRNSPFLGLLKASPLAIIFLVMMACSGESLPLPELLLNQEDFPDVSVVETDRQVGVTSDGQPSGLIALSGPDFTVLHSIVMFESDSAALSTLSGIKSDQIAQGVTAEEMPGFKDATGVREEVRGDEETATLFFVEGTALVKVTVTGVERRRLLSRLAEAARDKAGRQ